MPESDGSLRLVFENGNTAICDLLIGVDGIKSIVRKKFVADHHSKETGQVPNADPMWSGTFAYRCMIESKLIAEQMPKHRVLTTPVIVSHRQCIFQRHSTNDIIIRSVLW
jgi:salicylate hydroxylase